MTTTHEAWQAKINADDLHPLTRCAEILRGIGEQSHNPHVKRDCRLGAWYLSEKAREPRPPREMEPIEENAA